ncbi:MULTISPECIES: RNA-binding cell elongation regulator Jag/EloR [Desulfitobacterium]|uniref:RNA-binding protein KhpB n=1 Tax=Desulfitobacterium dehalogenans (strain ATCC 51507 / DSM 9161 / JW/IU-DC1) TaxID=756499 RepID=I4AEX4_DESDJ|nr:MULTISPECIES: RNA-binding cell elongation regulator Jag/EloR [Desulfitobacterium]AFM02509.1 putative RNA-binding protein [Desulfitobacterium dehalogenans ATCC 51507]
MRFVEKTGKTVEEAINACLNELGVERDRVRIEVLEEPTKKGLFGLLGTTLAKVRVSYEDCLGELACSFLKDVCNSMGVSAEFKYTQQGQHWLVDISGEELGILIGRRGDTLEALQYLTNLAVAKQVSEKVRIIIDVEGYRQRREETLVRLAKRLSDKVKRTGTRVVLEPMNPHERRIIHTALQDDARISTFSEGEEPNRKVVISLKRTKEIS